MGTIEMRYVNAVLTERRREHSEGLSDDFWRVFLDIVTLRAVFFDLVLWGLAGMELQVTMSSSFHKT